MSAIYRLIKYAASSQDERDATKSAPFSAGFYGRFPISLGMYYAGAGPDYKSQRFYLGSEDDGKLYALTFHDAYGLHQMTLYSTPEYKAPLLGLALNETRLGSGATITLPPTSSSSSTGEQGGNRVEKLKYNFQRSTHSFTVVVGRGTDARTETFEWRDDKKPKPKIRRLTRIAPEGLEIVAVWKEGSVPNRQRRLATLEFFESGATGELGELWTLMAVVSALRVCQSQWWVPF